jgi:hypothetical protein
MNFENLAVKHKAFGDGVVVSSEGKYLKVRFSVGEKTFVYPDIFEKFLTLADGTVSEEILADLSVAHGVKQARIDKKNAENMHSMIHGIVIPGKEILSESEDEENRYKNAESEEI